MILASERELERSAGWSRAPSEALPQNTLRLCAVQPAAHAATPAVRAPDASSAQRSAATVGSADVDRERAAQEAPPLTLSSRSRPRSHRARCTGRYRRERLDTANGKLQDDRARRSSGTCSHREPKRRRAVPVVALPDTGAADTLDALRLPDSESLCRSRRNPRPRSPQSIICNVADAPDSGRGTSPPRPAGELPVRDRS
jgi:hypothetical protein